MSELYMVQFSLPIFFIMSDSILRIKKHTMPTRVALFFLFMACTLLALVTLLYVHCCVTHQIILPSLEAEMSPAGILP